MKIKHTQHTHGESDPYQALANAIIVCAVRDFRNSARMIRKIQQNMKRRSTLNNSDVEFMTLRIDHYQFLQEHVAAFILSDEFSILCGLNGSDLLDRLESEIA